MPGVEMSTSVYLIVVLIIIIFLISNMNSYCVKTFCLHFRLRSAEFLKVVDVFFFPQKKTLLPTVDVQF